MWIENLVHANSVPKDRGDSSLPEIMVFRILIIMWKRFRAWSRNLPAVSLVTNADLKAASP